MSKEQEREALILNYGDACFRCGEYPGEDRKRYAELSEQRRNAHEALLAALASPAAEPVQALTVDQLEANGYVQIHIDQYDKLECFRRMLEIIALGDSADPRADARQELVAQGFWNDEATLASPPATKAGWIPVSERLPAYGERALAWDGERIGTATHYSDAWGSVTHMHDITHWMPLPPAPEGAA